MRYGGAWDEMRRRFAGFWQGLGQEPWPTILQLIPAGLMVVASINSLDAANKANETSEQAYKTSTQAVKISESSQRLAEQVAERERLGGRADLLASFEEERCWKAQDGKSLCSAVFTLTNAGKYGAENIAVFIAHHQVYGPRISMQLPGDLPGGQHQQFATESYSYDDRFTARPNVILAVAYRDKELALCPNKSWAFRPATSTADNSLNKLIGAAATSSTGWAESGAASASYRKDCREPGKGELANS